MKFLNLLANGIDALNETIGRLVSWFTLGMVAITFAVVVLRYAFNLGWIAMQESVTYLHALVFMLGAAYTLRHDGHVRVDIFYGKLGVRGRAWVDLAGAVLLLLPVAGFILWVSWEYVAASWSLLEGSREQGGLPAVFLLKSAIPALSILLILQGVSQAIHALSVITGQGAEAASSQPMTEL